LCTDWIVWPATWTSCAAWCGSSPSAGIRIEFVKEWLSFTGENSPMANLLLSVMRAFAEFERVLIRSGRERGAR
jgi:hypothetical protein